jgi:alkylation response protein AidB-like acyl-CoA dehydrogenase
MSALITERELEFLLYEFLDTKGLLARPRYQDHSKEIFGATLESARRLATDLFAPHYVKGDREEAVFTNGQASVIPETTAAWNAFAQAGFLNAHWDEDEGGLHMPEVVLRSAMSLFFAANTGTMAYPFLTIGAANLLRAFGSQEQKRLYLPAMGTGGSAGTMCLTEPGQGSALGDIKTMAFPHPDGSFRVVGQKMFISGGDQNITDNIVHMVLARIEGAPAGAAGISLFLVPKYLVKDDGTPGKRNDVALAGLLHKMGWRNTTSTVLSFGENGGAVGYLLGEAHRGLAHMFQMMNEARIGVGLIAACLAYRGFAESLAYARERPQGRLPSSKDPVSPQVQLLAHADVRRLLLAQKSYAEGALALCLYASSLFEDQHTHPDPDRRKSARLLLDVLTPVVKSWPAKYGCCSNEMAMQVLGGAGYTREYPLEQLYRDQRLNPIHEGAEAIHGLDLLGRKVLMNNGAAFELFCSAIAKDMAIAREHPELQARANALADALTGLKAVTTALGELHRKDPDLALANATLYLDTFGRITAAWMWLKQAIVAARALSLAAGGAGSGYYLGKLQAAHYYFQWELPATAAQCAQLLAVDRVPFEMKDEWFQ